jgi:hypothetical protein
MPLMFKLGAYGYVLLNLVVLGTMFFSFGVKDPFIIMNV